MEPILFVDLDESLIKTDIMREQLIRSFSISPWKTLKILFKSRFQPERAKAAIVDEIDIDPKTLPYNAEVLALIHQAKTEGRQVVLATATHEKVANQIAKHLGIFDAVLATTDTYNCKGKKKVAMMQNFAKGRPFDYVGDSRADFPIFKEAQTPYIVGGLPYPGQHQRIKRPSIIKPFLKVMRPYQWSKNVLIFLPLIISHNVSWFMIMTATLGFICFSLVASALYILNDMVDVEDDRHHSEKKNRPFAQGDLTIDEGIGLGYALLTFGIVLSCIWLPSGLWVLCSYGILTFLYRFLLKVQLAVLSMFCLGSLCASRVLYGQAINHIESSTWLLLACVFFFLILGFTKQSYLKYHLK
ncbi:MAG: UbiA family prenyltransferase [Candidatus Paracaedibacter sp.]